MSLMYLSHSFRIPQAIELFLSINMSTEFMELWIRSNDEIDKKYEDEIKEKLMQQLKIKTPKRFWVKLFASRYITDACVMITIFTDSNNFDPNYVKLKNRHLYDIISPYLKFY